MAKENPEVATKAPYGTDVVTNVDFAVERAVKKYLKQLPSAWIYGEEDGLLAFSESPKDIITIDPIDGTRCLAGGYAKSSIVLTDYAHIGNGRYQAIAGFVLLINNTTDQIDDFIICENGEICKNDVPFSKKTVATVSKLAEGTVGLTYAKSFKNTSPHPTALERIAVKLFLNIAELSQGEYSYFSGAAQILGVITGEMVAFVNLCSNDIVSHGAPLLMAKAMGLGVRHVFTEGDNFDLLIENTTGKPSIKYVCDDGTLMVFAKGLDPERTKATLLSYGEGLIF